MARGPKIDTSARVMIAEAYFENPKRSPDDIQKAVTSRLHKKNPALERNWPGISAVRQVLTKIRKYSDKRDEPWSTASLIDYPIPPEHQPEVIRAYSERTTEKIDYYWPDITQHPLTIREVQHLARIYGFFKDLPDGRRLLHEFVSLNALRERACNALGINFYTSDIDKRMSSEIEIARHKSTKTS
jgi:hypothetical protein